MSPAPARSLLMAPAPAGAGPWTPASLPLLGAWDFSDTAKITSAGGLVSAVAGVYGTAVGLTQGTGANQPSTAVSTLNGLNVLTSHFRSWLTGTLGAGQSQPFTFVMLAKSTTTGAWQYALGNTGGSAYYFLTQGSTQNGINAGTQQNAVAQDLAGNIDIVGVNGASSTFHRNGVVKTLGGSPGTNALTTGILVSSGGDAGIIGDVAEAWIVSGVLSTPDRVAAEAFLTTKWGLNWTPASLSGLVGWWDASDTATITGSPGVSSWAAKSGAAGPLVQGTGANQPVTGVNTINGLNVIKYVDATDALINASVTTASPFTLLVVSRPAALSGVQGVIYGAGTDYTLYTVGGDYYCKAGGGSAGNIGLSASNGVVYSHVFQNASGANSNGWRNRTQTVTNQDVAANAFTSLRAGNGWIGDIAEIVLMSGGISAANRNAWHDYTTRKWGTV